MKNWSFEDDHERSWVKKLPCEMWCDQCLQHFLQLLTRAVGGKLCGVSPTEKPSALVKADQNCVAQFIVVNPLLAERLRQIHAEYEQT